MIGQSRVLGLMAMGLFATSTALGCTTTTVVSGSPGSQAAPTDPGTDGSGDGNGETPGTTSGDGGTTTTKKPPAQPDKPGCAQDKYTETLPTKTSLTGISFSQASANNYLLSALDKRYPLGETIVNGGLSSPEAASQGNCIDRFLDDKSNANAVLRGASTVVHECGHLFDLGDSSGDASTYHIRADLKFTCNGGDTTDRGGKTFARSLIKQDAQYSKRVACASGTAASGCDMYAPIYLDGSPTDSTFDSGDQGYNFLLEEATQYVNSLASAYAFQDAYVNQSASERDGILTFLWYIERYLAMARTQYPDAYKALSQDACWRQATLSVWDRGMFYLDASKSLSSLGIDDAAIETLVNDPTLLAEIDSLRALECQ